MVTCYILCISYYFLYEMYHIPYMLYTGWWQRGGDLQRWWKEVWRVRSPEGNATIYCILYITVYVILYTIYYIPYAILYTVYYIYCKLYTIYYILYTIHFIRGGDLQRWWKEVWRVRSPEGNATHVTCHHSSQLGKGLLINLQTRPLHANEGNQTTREGGNLPDKARDPLLSLTHKAHA